jgi:hypothetical protein
MLAAASTALSKKSIKVRTLESLLADRHKSKGAAATAATAPADPKKNRGSCSKKKLLSPGKAPIVLGGGSSGGERTLTRAGKPKIRTGGSIRE